MQCPDCDATNPAGARFCGTCGHALASVCPSCGATTEADQRFCRDCGTPLTPTPDASAGVPSAPRPPARTTERRVVSVMFADLVGSTDIAERRDAEEVRDLLTRYFETCRTVIGRYGGTVEKFIGDAVMAVWGAPTAHQDDAERAVRAALDIVAEVAALGEEAGVERLAARAGVATGEVAVTLGAVGQGIVAGDTVNTAARVQTAARPGGVRVDGATRRASAAAIAFRDAGVHELKGKATPEPLFDADRVVATVGGAQRVDGLEAPFVGRDRELRLLKELFHGTEESGRARLVSVTGPAGVGKSRLGWEFFKYLDGLAGTVLWHSGRCPPYGDGVALWPLAEMVRMRFRITDGDTRAEVTDKLRDGLAEHVPAVEDREWLAPRLGTLLGVEESTNGAARPREDLFGAWRLLFESLAREAPVVMLVEELQWADAGLMDFIEDLLDLSHDFPLFVLTLARPELEDRRPGWGSGRRNITALPLDPLPRTAVAAIVDGLVAGLPTATRDAIVVQAEGIPLYAVETIRMLVDRDLVVREDGRYVVAPTAAEQLTGTDLSALGVPPSLAALVRARLDELPVAERELVADAAVLGTSFPGDVVGRLVELPPAQLDTLLRVLVRKEVLAVTVDPRSPERGQYRFVQPLVRAVAYGTLSRRDRKLKHLAVAQRLEADVPDVAEIADVLADHYEAAYQAGSTDHDAPDVRARALRAYRAAGDRALSLAAPESALVSYRRAVDLAVDEHQTAELLALAGRAAAFAGMPVAVDLLTRAVELHEEAGRADDAVRAIIELARALTNVEQHAEAAQLLDRTLASRDRGEPDEHAARLAAFLAVTTRFAGRSDDVQGPLEVALTYGQALELADVVAVALIARGNLMMDRGRYLEADFDYTASLTLAERHDLSAQRGACAGALANLRLMLDFPGAREPAELSLQIRRRQGLRRMEVIALGNLVLLEIMTGRWDRAEQLAQEGLELETAPGRDLLHERLALLASLRGQLGPARVHAEACRPVLDSRDLETRAMARAALATVALAEGDLETAWATGLAVLEESRSLGLASEGVRQAWPDVMEAALALGDLSRAEELLAYLAGEPPGKVPPYLRAQHLRCRALVDRARGTAAAAETGLGRALEAFRKLDYPFWVARTLLDLGTLLHELGRDEDAAPLLDEAGATFDSLEARPWSDRVRALEAR